MNSSFDTLLDLLARTEFIGGLIAGTVAFAFIVVVGMGKGGTGWGVALTAATIAAVFATFGRRLGLTGGLLALLVGGWLLDREERSGQSGNLTPVAWAALVGGAVVVSVRGGLPSDLWIQFLVPAFIVSFGFWLRAWRGLPQHTLLGPLFALTAFGVWTTVPETDTARILLGASLPMSLATLPRVDLRISSSGAFGIAGTMAWIAADGGAPRPGSVIGAIGASGMLLLLPVLAERAQTLSSWTVVTLQLLMVVVSARIFGLWEEALPAAVGVISMFAAVYLGLFLSHGNSARSDTESPRARAPGSP